LAEVGLGQPMPTAVIAKYADQIVEADLTAVKAEAEKLMDHPLWGEISSMTLAELVQST